LKSIAIIGGGIIGTTCALRLAQSGHRVVVLDAPQERRAASWGNAGHIAIEQVAPLASLDSLRSISRRLFSAGGPIALPPALVAKWAPFGLRMLAASRPSRFAKGKRALSALMGDAAGAWRRLTDDLGISSLARFDGHFVSWEEDKAAAQGRKVWSATTSETVSLRDATGSELDRLRAVSPRIIDAIRFVGTGQVTDLDDVATALRQALDSAGVDLKPCEANLQVAADGSAFVPGVPSDLVLIAAGVGSARLMRAAGHRVPLIAERGYHIRSRDFDWPADLPPLVFEDRSLIVTRFRRSVQASSFVEFGSAEAPPDERKWQRLEQHVAELGLPMRPPFERWMGARPTLPDYLPAIGRSGRAPNLFYAFGHQHLGLTLAPITAELIRSEIDGTKVAVDIAPFTLDRF
jgi:D-amino-acid dehydrogenase